MGGEDAPLAGPDLTNGVAGGEIGEGGILLGHADGEPVLLARCDGVLSAVGARCTHYGGPLAEGLVVGDTIRCPWHHAAFSLRTGEAERPPALSSLPCWDVEERDGTATVVGRRAVGAAAHSRRAAGGPESVLIIGGGAAGFVAAETLRREGYEGSVAIVDAGSDAPCDRPNLSKDYLAGTAPEEWIPLRPPSFYDEQRIDLLLDAPVTHIDAAARTVRFRDGSDRAFGALLIATGSRPVTLDITTAGARLYYLRSLADSRAIIQASAEATRAVVLGASFIGLEVAASLRARGLDVTVVAPEARPLERVLGPQLGDFIRGLHEEHGVAFRLGHVAAAIDATGVTLDSGERLHADFVVAGIGVRPETALAADAGLAVEGGILVNEYLETSAPGIYAAGDVARWPDERSGERIRVEHWVVAERQGQTAARNILAGPVGARERFDAVPFFWSQHYDVSINYVGHATKWDAVEIEGNIGSRDCVVSYRADGQTRAVATIFRDRESLAAELALERGVIS
jgi:NADPH-dependent 2,4-dienoyl-CoA reductase/sulfur reductase-like enzyme/nitrite reductase/ring-hydroxylating ferredoxin subunit